MRHNSLCLSLTFFCFLEVIWKLKTSWSTSGLWNPPSFSGRSSSGCQDNWLELCIEACGGPSISDILLLSDVTRVFVFSEVSCYLFPRLVGMLSHKPVYFPCFPSSCAVFLVHPIGGVQLARWQSLSRRLWLKRMSATCWAGLSLIGRCQLLPSLHSSVSIQTFPFRKKHCSSVADSSYGKKNSWQDNFYIMLRMKIEVKPSCYVESAKKGQTVKPSGSASFVVAKTKHGRWGCDFIGICDYFTDHSAASVSHQGRVEVVDWLPLG